MHKDGLSDTNATSRLGRRLLTGKGSKSKKKVVVSASFLTPTAQITHNRRYVMLYATQAKQNPYQVGCRTRRRFRATRIKSSRFPIAPIKLNVMKYVTSAGPARDEVTTGNSGSAPEYRYDCARTLTSRLSHEGG